MEKLPGPSYEICGSAVCGKCHGSLTTTACDEYIMIEYSKNPECSIKSFRNCLKQTGTNAIVNFIIFH